MTNNKIENIKSETKINYQEIAEAMSEELKKNKDEWQERFGKYISVIMDNREQIANAVDGLFQKYPIKLYLPLNRVNNNPDSIIFDVRYKGINLGTVNVNPEKSVFHPISNHIENLVSDVNSFNGLNDECWNEGLLNEISQLLEPEINIQREHQFESFLLDNFGKTQFTNKILPWSTHISWEGNRKTCFQMPTTWRGSKFSEKDYTQDKLIYGIKNGDFWATDSQGGGIDILARRSHGGKTTRLSIMELKNPDNSYSENRVILQALSYSVFIRELIRSEKANGGSWWKFFMNGRKASSEKLKLEAVVVLSKQERNNIPAFENTVIKLGSDTIELGYLYLKEEDGSWVFYDSSLKMWNTNQ